ncbi:MAG: hypothetical protein AAGA93_09770 [Actinomycetota bacterium]
MVATLTQQLIQQIRSEMHGQLSDRRRVMDHLLDIRLEMSDHPAVVSEVDRLLGDLPGLTTVENEWLGRALDELELAVSALPTS